MAKQPFHRIGTLTGGRVIQTLTLPSGQKVINFDEAAHTRALAAASNVLRAIGRQP